MLLVQKGEGTHSHLNTPLILTSGGFKGRQVRHLPRAPPFWGPLEVLRV